MSGCRLGITTSGSDVPGEAVWVFLGGVTGSIVVGSQGVVVLVGRWLRVVVVVVVVVVMVVVVVVVVVVALVVVGVGMVVGLVRDVVGFPESVEVVPVPVGEVVELLPGKEGVSVPVGLGRRVLTPELVMGTVTGIGSMGEKVGAVPGLGVTLEEPSGDGEGVGSGERGGRSDDGGEGWLGEDVGVGRTETEVSTVGKTTMGEAPVSVVDVRALALVPDLVPVLACVGEEDGGEGGEEGEWEGITTGEVCEDGTAVG